MVRGIERRRIVDDDLDRRKFVARVGELALATNTKAYAWALLSDFNEGTQGSLPVHAQANDGLRRPLQYPPSPLQAPLFQNRYKSIVCDADSYFTELVRYIHLNPLRVKLVKDMGELERYPYCGHGAITGRVNYPCWLSH